jgi:hypothetical protein
MTKTKYGNKLGTEAGPIVPDFELMCSSKQPHPSHRDINTVHITCIVLLIDLTDSEDLLIFLFPYKHEKQGYVKYFSLEEGSTDEKV